MLERYGHGGDLRTAAEAFGRSEDGFIDFSSNMNPFGPPDIVRTILREYADRIHTYPDPAVRELRQALAARHGIDESCILVGNGAAELIDLVVRYIKPSRVGLTVPCFSEYGEAAAKADAEIVTLQLDSGASFELASKQIRGMKKQPDLWFLGSPNNPTGRRIAPGIIVEGMKNGHSFVVDEAFLDFVQGSERFSLIRDAVMSDRLFVVRSLTKFYAIPGIRLGYIVGKADRIAALRELQVPWSVNSLAQLIGCAVLQDKAYEARTLSWLAGERPWFIERLRSLGLRVNESDTNYLLAGLPAESIWQASTLQQELGKQGILIRDASLFEGLDHSWFRIAIRLREQNEQLLSVLKSVLAMPAAEAEAIG
ncbi:threonine-phosphate decarboxylase CobD [Paenibacillus abyssi]|uniref:threonine-phosphate decarboxylase n=1 Tax=Paenibacillus abyssi TaxID=1340531 RepID=A0A917FWI2_9BACL|nr:threonine-phosphate decarboxylase CobD [Paenibacillus abyssi]GGG11617.1 threonine-phosphate decarboxylase [Paenibacillus abyssi]